MGLKETIEARKSALQYEAELKLKREKEEKEEEKVAQERAMQEKKEKLLNTPEIQELIKFAKSKEIQDMMFQIWSYFFDKQVYNIFGQRTVRQTPFNVETDVDILNNCVRVCFQYDIEPKTKDRSTRSFVLWIDFDENREKIQILKHYKESVSTLYGPPDYMHAVLAFNNPNDVLEFITDAVANDSTKDLEAFALDYRSRTG